MSRKRPRGFVLVVVMIVGAAAVVGTVALLQGAGAANIAAVRTEVADISSSIAESGMERAIGYADRVAAINADFDLLLDPQREVDCGANPIAPSTNHGIPRFTDAGSANITYKDKRYMRVPFSGGAYLLRYDDDFDDMITNAQWNDFTSNTTRSNGDACSEGPGINKNNPVRDRNRTVWITAIGIYPGTDPDKARHRTVLRRLYSYQTPPTVAGIVVKGSISVGGNAQLKACSPIAGLHIDGDVNVPSASGSSFMCGCGESLAEGWKVNSVQIASDSSTSKLYHCSKFATVGEASDPCRLISGHSKTCADGTLKRPSPAVTDIPNAVSRVDDYIDWTRSCIFYVDKTDHVIWFWDASSNRGRDGEDCSTLEGQNVPWGDITPPNPEKAATSGADAWKGCWTPLVVRMNITDGNCNNVGNNLGSNYAAGACWYTGPVLDPVTTLPTERRPAEGEAGKKGDTMCTGGPFVVGGSTSSENCRWLPDGTTSVTGTTTDVNARLAAAGAVAGQPRPPGVPSLFPIGLRANKPAWSTACQVLYPPPVTGVTSQTYNCTTCDGTETALRYFSGLNHLWFPANGTSQTTAQIRAIPAGIYHFTGGLTLTGSAAAFSNDPAATAPTARFPIPDTGTVPAPLGASPPASDYPLISLYMAGTSLDQQQPFFTGVGQGWSSPGNVDGGPSYWSVVTDGSAALRGTARQAVVGSIYTKNSFAWEGDSKRYLFGGIFTDNSFNLSGGGEFLWLYNAYLKEPPIEIPGFPLGIRSMK